MAIRGAILGDIIGSRFEGHRCENPKGIRFLTERCRFTDDTVLSIAVKEHFITGDPMDFCLRKYAYLYPHAGFGSGFKMWVYGDNRFRPSFGNGSAMRVSYVSDIAHSIQEAEELAKETAEPSHNTKDGIDGAVVIAVCGYMAKNNYTKQDILEYAGKYYPEILYNDHNSLNYGWSATCRWSVPLAVRCFFDSTDYSDCMRTVLSHHCDADTVCAMAGGIAENYGGIPDNLNTKFEEYLTEQLRDVLNA